MRVVANRAAETITATVRKRFSSLIIELPVQQAGSGDPSPDNIRPIAQWTDVELYVADTDTATEPTVTTTLPTAIFGGMVDVARGEVASLYNEKKSSSGWEMVEEGQFRCQVGAFNNGDETSTNVADLYSSHYKTVSNKDAYDATDDLTCGTPTIEGVTYLYVNDLDYTTLEAFTAYIGDVQFVYKSHIPMSDEIAPTIVYLPEGTSYVWATASYEVITLTGTAPLELPNAAPRDMVGFETNIIPVQDLHGQSAPYPAGCWNQLINPAIYQSQSGTSATVVFTVNADGSVKAKGTAQSTTAAFNLISNYNMHITAGDYILGFKAVGTVNGSCYLVTSGGTGTTGVPYKSVLVTGSAMENSLQFTASDDGDLQYLIIQIANGGSVDCTFYPIIEKGTTYSGWSPYSNICPIIGWETIHGYVEEQYDPTATPKVSVTFGTLGKNLLNLNRPVGTPTPDNVSNETNPRVMDTEHYYVGITRNNYYSGTRDVTSYSVSENEVTLTAISGGYGIGFPVKTDANTRYIVSYTNVANGKISVGFYDSYWNYISNLDNVTYFDTPQNSAYTLIVVCPISHGSSNPATLRNIQVEKGGSATSYEPYTDTAHSGTHDFVSGQLVDEGYTKTFDGTESYSSSYWGGMYVVIIDGNYTGCIKCSICLPTDTLTLRTHRCYAEYSEVLGKTVVGFGFGNEYATSTDFANMVAQAYADGKPLTVTLKRAESIIHQLDPVTVTLTIGDNYVWSDCGDTITATYWGKEQ